MSLTIFDHFLRFAESAVAAKGELPVTVDGDELENALVSYGVVLLHSHMEQCYRTAIEMRCARCTDTEIRAFALSVRDEKARKVGIGSLKDTLGRFSDEYKVGFRADLESSESADLWESVKNQRATVAHHGQPATCSLPDLRTYYFHVRKVLGLFCSRLGLDHSEVAKISGLIIMPERAIPSTNADESILDGPISADRSDAMGSSCPTTTKDLKETSL